MRSLLITAICAVFALASSAVASAATFRGTTAQQKKVTVRTGDDGLIRSLSVRWTAACKRPGMRFRQPTKFSRPFDESTVDLLRDGGTYTTRQRKPRLRFRVTTSVEATRSFADPANPATERWSGTLRATVAVRRRGRTIDRCTLAPTGWSATLVPQQLSR